ncbi:MAG: hypothetical protein NT062_22465, partial [Proteobacteria bacterium]|nr:hypothetical protein [Pseudomonadota bacterium]
MGRRWLFCVVLCASVARAHADVLDRLGDPATVAAAITEIEGAPPGEPDTLFVAARACEDALHDPARALRLYDRVLREAPTSGIAIAAQRRADRLRAQVGGDGSHAAEARDLATLIARADALPAAEVEATAARLAALPWPGAAEAALWHAEWLRQRGRFADAARHYDEVTARWPGTPPAIAARRGRVGVAIDA